MRTICSLRCAYNVCSLVKAWDSVDIAAPLCMAGAAQSVVAQLLVGLLSFYLNMRS